MDRTNGFKSEQVAAILRERIITGEYPLGSRLPCCAELVKLYGISHVTAYKVLARLEQDGYVTLKKHVGSTVCYIREASVPTCPVVNLISGAAHISIYEDFFDQGKKVFDETGWEVRQFRLSRASVLPDDILLAVNQPDAFSIFMGVQEIFRNTLATLDHFYQRAIYIGEYLGDPRLTCVTCDEAASIRLILEHFHAQGRTRTAIVRYSMKNLTEDMRLTYWRSEMMGAGASFRWCTDHTFYCKATPKHEETAWMYDSFEGLWASGRLMEIDSIIIPNELHASIFEEICASKGIRIPQDIAIVTIGNDPCCSTAKPSLSHLDNNLGRHLELARDIVEGRLRGDGILQQFYAFQPSLKIAGSSCVKN